MCLWQLALGLSSAREARKQVRPWLQTLPPKARARAIKYALPYLRKTRGSIINLGSLVGQIGQEWATTYAATKGAVSALTKALAVDKARHGVRVNAVLPGCIGTPAHRDRPKELQDFVDSWQWTGRVGTIEEVGYACLFLASDGASFITGIDLLVTGGAELAYGVKWPKEGRIQL